MNKQKTLVLSIGFALIALTCIILVVFLIRDISNESIDHIGKKLIAPIYFFFAFPIILEELSLLRSVYKILNFNPKTSAKICYIISAVIASLALVFQLLVYTKVITHDIFPDGPTAQAYLSEMLLLIEWSAVFASFILGSIKSGNKKQK